MSNETHRLSAACRRAGSSERGRRRRGAFGVLITWHPGYGVDSVTANSATSTCRPHEAIHWHALTGDFYCVDVGSRGGLDDLRTLHPRLHVYSIDADPAAETREQPFASHRHFSLALHSWEGEMDLFVAARPSLSSLLEFDSGAFTRHFGLMPGSEHWARALTPQRKQTTKTETADRFFRSHLDRIDFLKLDTQGTELEILKGARDYLSEGRIAVIKTEVSLQPVYRDQCTFSEIDRFLKEQGFRFVDCAFYPDAVGAESSAKAVRGTGLHEQTRFSAGGDAFYVLDPLRYGGADKPGFTVRAAVLLNQLGYVSVALDVLRNGSFPADRIEALLRATAPVDPRSRLKRALKNYLPPFAYRGIQRVRQRLRSGG
jgi:FkbM family methyltransferase